MKPKIVPDLSRAEYDILRVIWRQGRQSVREVHDALQSAHNWAYTTTKTMMDRMVKKGLLERQSFHGVFLYKALISRPAGLVRFIQFFADRVLEMDSEALVSMFARGNTLSEAEIEELRQLLDADNRKDEVSHG